MGQFEVAVDNVIIAALSAAPQVPEAMLSKVKETIDGWRGSSPYMHSCCHEAVRELIAEIDAAMLDSQPEPKA